MTCRTEGTCGTLGIYWSLSLENQFYLLLPLFLFAFNNKKLCMVMLVIFLIQFFIPRTLNAETPAGWAVRTDAIALGVIIATLSSKSFYQRFDPKTLNSGLITSLLFLILIFLLAIFTKPDPVVFFQVGLTACVSGIFVFIASYNKNYFARNNLIKRICDFIGSRSYSLYLTHVLALLMTRELFMRHDPDYTITGTLLRLAFFLTLTMLFTEFSYRAIENKYRYFWKKSAKRKPSEQNSIP